MKLEWSTVVRDGNVWGWRLYDKDVKPHMMGHIEAEVRPLLCRTKQAFKIWLFGVKVGQHRKMFYTEEEAKAWTIAIVRM